MLIIVRNDDQQMLLSCDNCTGNSRFSGFAIDLLTAISKVGQVFLDALASLKTMFDIQSVINSCFQDFKIKEY